MSTFRRLGVPIKILIPLLILFSGFVMNSMMAITLWKDVPYSIAVLLFTTLLLKIVFSNGEWLLISSHILWLGLVGALVALFRHNGFPVSLITLIILLVIYKHFWKHISAAIGVILLILLVVQGPFYSIINVNRTDTQPIAIAFVHPIAAHVRAGMDFTVEEKQFLNQIYPLHEKWHYSCFDATVFFYKGVNFSPVREYPVETAKLFLRTTISNPEVTLRHFYCLSTFVWKPLQPNGVYLETLIFDNYQVENHPYLRETQKYVRGNSLIPSLRNWHIQRYEDLVEFDPYMILWRPAVYLYLFFAAVLFTCIRLRSLRFVVLLSPVLIHSMIIMLVAQLQAVRYMYPVYIISMLMTIPLIYLSITRKST
jgi:hypothetical protein